MRVRQVQESKKEILVHDFNKGLNHTIRAIERELSERNVEIIKRYDKEIVRRSLAKELA